MKSEKRKGFDWQFWLGMGVSLACLLGIFLFIDFGEIWRALKIVRYEYLLLSGVAYFVFLVIRAIRWRFMLGNRVGLGQVYHIQNIGYMFNYLLPARIGDLTRAVLIGNVPPIKMAQGISTMLVERVLDLLFMATFLPFTLATVEALPDDVQGVARNAGILGVAAVVFLIVAANTPDITRRLARWGLDFIPFMDTESWLKRVDEVILGLDSLTRLKDGGWLLFLSVLVWVPIVYSYYWVLVGVGLDVTLLMAGFVMCAAAFSIAAPSSPGQVGVFQAGVIFALTQILGQPGGQSASFAFLYHAFSFVLAIVFGLLGLRSTQSTFSNVVQAARDFAKKK